MPLPRKSDTVFFVSGAAALIYQIVWMRLLARLLGSDALGTACVLAVFLGGLGLGAWLPARRLGSLRHPAATYAGLGVLTALWAVLSPVLLQGLHPVGSLPTRASVAALVLLVPTFCMGATFPLMGRLTLRRLATDGGELAGFYGANTLGAAAGALAAPFLLLPLLGLTRTLWTGAALDLVAALLALTLRVPSAEPRSPSAPAPRPSATPAAAAPLLAATALLGASSLALEVLLTRLLTSVTGASVYAFAIVLAVFLTGLGLGSRQGRVWLAVPGSGRRWLGLAALGAPVGTLAGLFLLRLQLGEADLFGGLANRLPTGVGHTRLWLSHALFAGLALLPPTFAFGLALPAAGAALLERAPGRPELELGRLYAANTAGAVAGALGAGLLLLPRLGLEGALFAALVPCALAALAAGVRLRALAAGLALAALLGLALGLPGHDRARLFLASGPTATVAVEEAPAGHRVLRVNGKVVATSAPVDLRLQRLLGLLPGWRHGAVRRALVVGLGTGMTAGSLLDLPDLERLDVVELSPEVVRAARRFAEFNGDLLDDPRTHVRVADGLHALALSTERYDLVTSDPIHPWTRGSSDLYALEHFSEIAAHLAPGGVASQWLPLYQLSTEDVRTVVATWCAAFPHTSAWLTAYDLALVGWLEPPPPLGDPLPALPSERAGAHLAEIGVDGPEGLAALLVADDARLRAFAAGTPPMRWDRPVLEFRAPRSYLAGYAVESLRWAGDPDFVARLPEPARPRARELRAALATFLEELPAGYEAAAERYGARLLGRPPERPAPSDVPGERVSSPASDPRD